MITRPGYLVLLSLLICLALGDARADQADFHASVLAVDGIARVTRGDSTFVVPKGAILHDGDRLSVEKGSVTLSWPDGSKARLIAGTRVTFTNAPEATKFKSALTHVKVESGSIFLNAVPGASRPSRFELRTNKSMGAVEGTLVECSYDPDKEVSTLQVWRGKVRCSYVCESGIVKCELADAGCRHVHNQKGGVAPPIDSKLGRDDAWPGP